MQNMLDWLCPGIAYTLRQRNIDMVSIVQSHMMLTSHIDTAGRMPQCKARMSELANNEYNRTTQTSHADVQQQEVLTASHQNLQGKQQTVGAQGSQHH